MDFVDALKISLGRFLFGFVLLLIDFDMLAFISSFLVLYI